MTPVPGDRVVIDGHEAEVIRTNLYVDREYVVARFADGAVIQLPADDPAFTRVEP